MTSISKQTLIAAVNDIVRPVVQKKELHTLTHKLVRQEVEKKLGLDQGTTSAPEYKTIIKEATENAMNDTRSDVEPEKEEVSKPRKSASGNKKRLSEASADNASNEHSTSPVSAPKRKRSSSKASPKRKTSRVKKLATPEPSEDGESDDEKYDEESEGVTSKSAQAKAKSQPKGKAIKKSPPSKATSGAKDRKSAPRIEESDAMNVDEGLQDRDEEPKPKKSKHNGESSKPKASKPRPKPSKTKSNVQYKSPEHVPTSDIEQDEPSISGTPGKAKDAEKLALPVKVDSGDEDMPPSKRRKSNSAAIIDPGNDGSETEQNKKKTEVPRKSKPTKSASPPKTKRADEAANDGDDSETGLSDLIDEPPKRKKQSKSVEKPSKAKEKTSKRTSSSKPALSKDEESIKRLKSYVLACGVRKVWAKLFKDVEPKAQITKLKEMLADLGMTGRYTLEKAKEIKQKREFEKELEDVQEFAKSMRDRESRSKGKGAEVEQSQSEDESEEEVVLPRKRGNARNSIAAFLQEQSGDSE